MNVGFYSAGWERIDAPVATQGYDENHRNKQNIKLKTY